MLSSVTTGYPQSYSLSGNANLAASNANSVDENSKPQNIQHKMLGASASQVKQLKAVAPKPSTIKKAWDKFKNWFNSSPKAQKILEKIENWVIKHFVKETVKEGINSLTDQNDPSAVNSENTDNSSNGILYQA